MYTCGGCYIHFTQFRIFGWKSYLYLIMKFKSCDFQLLVEQGALLRKMYI